MDSRGTAWAHPLLHYYSAALLSARGRLDDAMAEADAGVTIAEQLTAFQLTVPLLGTLTRLAVLRGDLEQGRDFRAKMAGHLANGITAATEDVEWPQALLLLAEGEPGRAFALLADLYGRLVEHPALIAQDPGAAPTLLGLALTAGDRPRAVVVAEAAARLAARNPGSHALAGAAAHTAGRLRRDHQQMRTAVAEFRLTARPLALASALHDAAVLGRDFEARETVQDWYDEALELVTVARAGGAQRGLVRDLGAWRGTAPPEVVDDEKPCLPQLSPAERQVARLIAAGMTNIVAARQLHLSRHTVDSHLRKIFQKLDIHSRVELATVVARECPP